MKLENSGKNSTRNFSRLPFIGLAAAAVWFAAVIIILIAVLCKEPLPVSVGEYLCELDGVNIAAEPVVVVQEEKEPEILPEYKEYYEQNNDMVGWLKLEGTNVDYPVMHVEGFDPDKPVDLGEVYDKNMYYLTRDFYKEDSRSGCVTADYRAHFTPDSRSANILLYGHNMSNGTFFRDVDKFNVNYYGREYYDKCPVIQFDTLYEKGYYKIFAMMQVNVLEEDGEVFYYTFTYDFKNKQEFIDYYAQVLDRSMIYNPEIDLQYGDEIIALSTCDFTFGKSKDLRFVLFARRVREGEDPTVDVSKTVINPDPLYYDYRYSVTGGSWGGRKWDPALLKGYVPEETDKQ